MYPKNRRQARKYIIQALYTWEISKNKISDIKKQYLKKMNLETTDIKYFEEVITEIITNYKTIDENIMLCLTRKTQKIGQIDKAILRLSFYEIFSRIDIPNKVSINEGIELAKIFGAKNSHKFINGVLNYAIHNLEIQSK